MRILLFGSGRICTLLAGKYRDEGHCVCQTDSVEEVSGLLAEAGGLELLVLGDEAFLEKADGGEFDRAEECYGQFAVRPLEVIRAALPCLGRGELKRIAYLTPVQASNNGCRTADRPGMRMAGAARNMQAEILWNRLSPEGYTMRIFGYEPDREPEAMAEAAKVYFTENRSADENPHHADENRLVMRDWQGREVPW